MRTLHKRDFVLVVVETADGERGVAPAGASSSAMREFFEGASQRTFADAVVDAYAENGFYWLEEPVSPDDYAGYGALADRTPVALAGGENESSAEGLRALGETGAVDFLQGDVRHHGGFTGCRTAADWCRGRDVEFVPHNFGTWLGLVANAHLVAAAPDAALLEYPVFEADPLLDAAGDPGMYPFDLAFDLLEEPPAVTDGRLTLPDAPGLGVEVDTDVVDEYPFVEGPWTTFEYDD